MPTLCEYKTVHSPNLVYGEVTVLIALVRLKAKQARCDPSLRNETKSEIINIRTTGKPGTALTAQLGLPE